MARPKKEQEPKRPHRSAPERDRLEANRIEKGKPVVASSRVKLEPGFTETENEKPPEGKVTATPPKRGPGRPSKLSGLKDNVAAMLALGVSTVDGVAHGLASRAWTSEDRLTREEIGMLTAALTDEVLKNPKLADRIARLADVSEKATLAVVLAAIVVPRLAGHGLLPRSIAEAIVNATGSKVTVPERQQTREQAPREAVRDEQLRTVGDAPTVRPAVPPSPAGGRAVDSLSGA